MSLLTKPSRREGAADTALRVLRGMLRSGQLSPGQSVRQVQTAEVLGISKIPLREALKTLASEGVLTYQTGVGYTVTRLSLNELKQGYRMRELLETELIRNLPPSSEEDIANLREINSRIGGAVESGDVQLISDLNHEFHFAMFAMSGLNLVIDQLERIWQMTSVYRLVHLYDDAGRARVVEEHEQMIASLSRQDHDEVVRLMDTHRNITAKDFALSMALPND